MQLPVLNNATAYKGARKGATRRSFLRKSVAFAGGITAFAAAISPLKDMKNAPARSLEDWFRDHYKELTQEQKDTLFADIAKDVKEQYGVDVTIDQPGPIPGVEYGYALNLSRCNGNRACVHACVKENNQSRSPEIQYIRVVEMPAGTFDLENGSHNFDEALVPKPDHYYMPIQCHQCADPPCVKVCPVEATWQEEDGITVIDYDWCIGCRYCQAACPYWARHFNFADPYIPEEEINPDMAYLSNRPRARGVMEKCHFCLQRTRKGRLPACLEACPTGARKFGNLLDPNSEVSQILRTKRIFVLKEDVGTRPRFFYYFDERTTRNGRGTA
ncbi:MAG: 4Fe-4S dicluster domain-containing protein [Phycisphaerae bacterium]|jgi:Fe-S-cluster-containing dehydrogenase component|nr:4Fe-4S dicluster domain-containing protein [Phycisphaerae bacterium]